MVAVPTEPAPRSRARLPREGRARADREADRRHARRRPTTWCDWPRRRRRCSRSATSSATTTAFQALARAHGPAALHRRRAPLRVQAARRGGRRDPRPDDPRPRSRALARALRGERSERMRLPRADAATSTSPRRASSSPTAASPTCRRAASARRAVRKFRVFQPGALRVGRPAGGQAALREAGGRRDRGDRGERTPAATRSRRRPKASFLPLRENRPVLVDGAEGRRVLKLALDIGAPGARAPASGSR